MEEALRRLGIDAALLPINGRDSEREGRGIVGNLTEREAAWLAAEMGADTLVPMHYDMFERNRGSPAYVVESLEREGREVRMLVPPRDVPFAVASIGRR
jgi:L-ascorbate metabolism protein UlaG (beta-lactamase superfamily)